MLLTLQKRIQTLLENDTYFSGSDVITEQVADIQTEVETAIGKLSFCVVIMTASGDGLEPAGETPHFTERLTVSIAQRPLTDKLRDSRNTVDGLEHAILAVHGKPVVADGMGPQRFRVVRHLAARTDDGLAIQEFVVEVSAKMKLEPVPSEEAPPA